MRSFGRALCVAAFCLVVATAQGQAPSPDLAGTWQGKLIVPGGSLRLVFHISKNAAGEYSGTVDSVDQGASGLPIKSASLVGHKARVEMAAPVASFEGTLSADGKRIEGQFMQNGATLPLTIERTTAESAARVAEVKRPQEPRKPYPYREEEVSYENPAGHVRLAATLTVPQGAGPFPAVVLITGSGPQNRNEELMGHKPFLVLADYLTRRGIAVLRADDRGVGGSTGSTANSTTADFCGDVLSGVAYLKTRREVDPKRIGLIGHSEGGVIAPMAASQSKDVAFIVLLAGTGLPGDEIVESQTVAMAVAAGAGEQAARAAVAPNHRLFEIIRSEPDAVACERKLREALGSTYDQLTDAQKKAAGDRDTFIKSALTSLMSPWFRYFVTYDPRPALRQVRCPVLALNGSKDLQVLPKLNLPEIEKALKVGGNSDCTVRELPGLNHLFQMATTGLPAEYRSIEETMSPTVLALIGDWIMAHTRPARP